MTVRKNFIFDEETAEHLKKIAEKEGKTQSQVVRELIESKYREYSVEEKLAALDRIVGSVKSGSLVGESVQSIKASMDI